MFLLFQHLLRLLHNQTKLSFIVKHKHKIQSDNMSSRMSANINTYVYTQHI